MFGLIYAAYGLAFWYGCKLVMDYREKPEDSSCIEQCLMSDDNGEIGGFDCFLNCDRWRLSITKPVSMTMLGSLWAR